MLEGTAKALLGLLNRLDTEEGLTYEKLVNSQKDAVEAAQKSLDELLELEGLCDATTLRTPTGRKRKPIRDRKQPGRRKASNVVELAAQTMQEA